MAARYRIDYGPLQHLDYRPSCCLTQPVAVHSLTMMPPTLQLRPTLRNTSLRLTPVILGGRQVLERRMKPVLVVVRHPLADQLAGSSKVAKVFLRERFTFAAVKAFDRAVRFRVLRPDPDVLKLELPHERLEVRRQTAIRCHSRAPRP
jgi:hypothetical protein